MTYTIQKQSIYKAWVILLLLYFNFPFYIKYFVSVQKLLIWGACLFYVLINISVILNKTKPINIQNDCAKVFFYLFWIFAIIVILVPIFHGTNEYAYYNRILYFTIRLVQYASIFIFIAKNIKKNKLMSYMECFVVSCSIYVIISVLMLVIPRLREIWLTIIYIQEHSIDALDSIYYISRFGLAGFSGFPCTFMCSIAIIFSLYMILNKYRRTLFFFGMIINLLGTFFYGRVGMLSSFVCILLFIGYDIIKKKNIKLFLALSICTLTIFFILLYLYNTNQIVLTWINWAFGPFRNLINTGTFRTHSLDVLFNMYFLPETTTLLFGDGKYLTSSGHYYMGTDAGFMRLMLYSGVFVQSLVYISALALLISCVLSLRKISKSSWGFMFILLGFTFLVFEFKGEMFFNFLAVLLPLALFNTEIRSIKAKVLKNLF